MAWDKRKKKFLELAEDKFSVLLEGSDDQLNKKKELIETFEKRLKDVNDNTKGWFRPACEFIFKWLFYIGIFALLGITAFDLWLLHDNNKSNCFYTPISSNYYKLLRLLLNDILKFSE